MRRTKKQHNKRKQTPTTHSSVWERQLCPFKPQGNPSSEMGWRSLSGHDSHNSKLFCSLGKGFPQNLYRLWHCVWLASSVLPVFPQTLKLIGERGSVGCLLALLLMGGRWNFLAQRFLSKGQLNTGLPGLHVRNTVRPKAFPSNNLVRKSLIPSNGCDEKASLCHFLLISSGPKRKKNVANYALRKLKEDIQYPSAACIWKCS